MKPSTPFCLMPWIHFHVGNNGITKACCVANIPFGNINDHSFNEIWNGEAIQELRRKFLNGDMDNRCATCTNLEATGGKSIRQETFEKFPDVRPTNFENKELPIYFDIRFSNVCNYRCRTCWHGASSKWFEEAKILKNNLGNKAIIQNIQDYEAFIEKMGKALLQAEEIYFAGGEPLATEEHYLLLEWLIKNKSTNIRLRYNTNFSMLSFKQHHVLEYWKHFPSVEILASIDAAGKHGEYIRKESNWKTILANRKKIRSLKHVQFKIAPTISILNLRHLPTLYKEALNLKLIQPNDFYINILERPFHYNIQAFPKEIKTTIQNEYEIFYEWLIANKIPKTIQSKFEECINYMLSEDRSKQWPKFNQETKRLDEMRGEVMNYELFRMFVSPHRPAGTSPKTGED